MVGFIGGGNWSTIRKSLTNFITTSTPRHESDLNQGLKKVRDRRFVGSDLTFSIPLKTDGPVETTNYGLELNGRLKVRVTNVTA